MVDEIFLIGRITKDLELKTTTTGKDVVSYTLAVQISKDVTEFINCTTFGEMAKTLTTYCNKGDLIAVIGQLRTNQYEDSNNVKHTSYYVLTNRVTFLSQKRDKTAKVEPEEKSIEKSTVDILESDLPF